VVMNTCSRGTPLSRTARPTSRSLRYMAAVSRWREPTTMASRTAAWQPPPVICQVPKPSSGMGPPGSRATAGWSASAAMLGPFAEGRPLTTTPACRPETRSCGRSGVAGMGGRGAGGEDLAGLRPGRQALDVVLEAILHSPVRGEYEERPPVLTAERAREPG